MYFLLVKKHVHGHVEYTHAVYNDEETAKHELAAWLIDDAKCKATYRYIANENDFELNEAAPDWFLGEGIYGEAGTSPNDVIVLFANINSSSVITMGSFEYSYMPFEDDDNDDDDNE